MWSSHNRVKNAKCRVVSRANSFRPQFIVMFRSRFNDAFPKSLANFGPQELERDVIESIPGDRVEHFLCAVLGLLLNRKQDVKYDAMPSIPQADNSLTGIGLVTTAEH
jgi:hypothetical protein